jgi:CDP-diacylglycerol--glycerol-3-phosphate 3-phosphatidyltransferase/cardiolipin synthase
VVAVAAASDWIDGRLARRTGRASAIGAFIDPVADKIFALVALVTLALEGSIPAWTLPLLLTRDIGVSVGALLLVAGGRRPRVKARRPGKAVTWLQFAAIGILIVLPSSVRWLAPLVAVAGIVALVDYARAARAGGPDASSSS